MLSSRIGRLVIVFALLGIGFGLMSSAVAAQRGGRSGKARGQVAGATFSEMTPPTAFVPDGSTPTGIIAETFPNSWHASSLGLTYDPVNDSVWYAHEGSAANPATIWNIDRPTPHPSIASYNLSALNPGFPVTLNDRDGVAYDPATQTFFIPDFQGDLSARDDNIVEINRSGTILNAWEMDGAGNDSSDATNINTIIDIAIIPGTPNRYFVTAAEGSGLIREIALTRAGLFVPATWNTVGTCTVADIGDSLGIDYDAGRNQLVVSSFNNELITYVNLDCTTVSQFLCDGPGTFHTGVTVIPGTTPREVWLTDFTSNQTTRCIEPWINLTKTVGADPSSCAGSDTLTAQGYALATYCYTVTNVTNDITFTTHTLTDTELGTILSDFPYTLVPGASAFITETTLITQATMNTATWTATNDDEDLGIALDRAQVTIAPAGVCTYYASTNVPVPIGPSPGVVTSTLTVADVYNLVDVNVYLTATHTWDSDLIFTLVAPDTTAIQLVNQRGGNGDNFTGTILDDHTATPITAGVPPFTGRFIPEQPLSAIHGDPSNGSYALRIEDVAAGDGGSLLAWGVELCRAPTASIGLSKTVGITAGACAPTDTISVSAGTTVYYCYTVTNTGEFTLPLHDLNDNELGTIFTDFLYELGPGESVSTVDAGLTISATITTTTVNTGTWTADIDGQLVSTASDTATVNVLSPTNTPTSTPTNTPTHTPTSTPTNTPTHTPTSVPGAPNINVNPTELAETHGNAPQVTTDTLTIGNTGTSTLTWTIIEHNSKQWTTPNLVSPHDPNAPSQRLGAAGGASTSPVVQGPIVEDGSFEAGTPNPVWEEFSTNFGTPLCDAVCGLGGGTGPRTGAWWAWFGGTTAAETGIITQTVTIPTGSAELSFWLEIPATATGTNGFLSVRMDGTEVFRAEETTTGYATYAEVTVDVSAYAGGTHELVFFSTTDAGAAVTNFFVDDVQIVVEVPPGCPAPADIPWLTQSTTSGSTAGGGSSPVIVTYDSAGLVDGIYTAVLCIASNDPDAPIIGIPVTLTVTRPTAIDLATFSSGIPAIPPVDFVAAALLLLASAAVVLRRK